MNAPAQVALLTPLGPAGITVLQLTGPAARDLLQPLLRDRKNRPVELAHGNHRTHHAFIVDSHGRRIDEVLVVRHPLAAPHLLALDICCHGGVRPAQKIMETLADAGAQPVPARHLPAAGLAGLIDITGAGCHGVAAEALAELCRAPTEQVARILLHQIQSGLSQELNRLLEPTVTADQLRQGVDRLLATWPLGRRLTNPAKLAIVGPTNAGKSSLANLLSGQTASIVTATPGTTRDWVTHQVSLAGLPVVLIDTAGHRPPADALEAQAIRRAIQQSRHADLQLLVIDGTSPAAHLPDLPPDLKTVLAVNKADLKDWSMDSVPEVFRNCPRIKTSALTGTGREQLTAALLQALDCLTINQIAPVVFTERQKLCLDQLAHELKTIRPQTLPSARNILRQCLRGP